MVLDYTTDPQVNPGRLWTRPGEGDILQGKMYYTVLPPVKATRSLFVSQTSTKAEWRRYSAAIRVLDHSKSERNDPHCGYAPFRLSFYGRV